MPPSPFILAVNGGSSSIKFALYRTGAALERRLHGKVDRIGLTGTTLSFVDLEGRRGSLTVPSSDHRSAVSFLLDWLEEQVGFSLIDAVGHRVVHGMEYGEHRLVSETLLAELRRISPYDPDHLPFEIELIEAFRERRTELPQVACFDTAFHRTMPRVARLLPIPRRFDAAGIRRYGFHGLSYAYLMEELAAVDGPRASRGRVILAHLGNGASLAAVREGQCIDTTMGFTPSGGLPMGTRPGDLDPGVAWYLMQHDSMSPERFNTLINRESGLLGISETSSDMRDLLARQADDIRAAEAVELFCYQARKWIGSFAAALAGLDTLVFSGGIGENAPEVRSRVCSGLAFLGLELDEAANAANASVISTAAGPATIRVIPTDEELMIARATCRLVREELPTGAKTLNPGEPSHE